VSDIVQTPSGQCRGVDADLTRKEARPRRPDVATLMSEVPVDRREMFNLIELFLALRVVER
jgi:hypothetical protein